MGTKRPTSVDQMLNRFFSTTTAAETSLKRAAMKHAGATAGATFEGGAVPDGLRAWVEKVARHAYKTTAEDVSAMKSAGYTEDQILETTIAAALGAGIGRMDVALRALDEAAKKGGR
jgi:alkylhydroperoxidase/carboxymuconolactone decarboxylase family protein YurZ